jgi:capsular exopolysaccharide synthesis family protein
VQLGPALVNVARSIWRQRQLVVAGLVVGVLLGYVALPRVLGGASTYEATVRMEVNASPADSIFGSAPAFGGGESDEGASTEALKDIAVADAVVKKLGPEGNELSASDLLGSLTITPLAGTALVDVAYPNGDPEFARAVVERYTELLRDRRNATESRKLDTAVGRLEESTGAREKLAEVAIARSTWPPTSIMGRPVVTSTGPPLSRQVTLAIGLLLGLAIGAGAALLVETALRKVIKPADVEEASGLPFIAEVRKTGIRRTPLPVVDRPFSPAAEDYRRVASALERKGLGADIRVLAIVSADPGDGKSMLAANLAYSIARQGREVVLVSSDLRRPQVEKLLGIAPGPGLAEALQDDPVPPIGLLVSINDHLMALRAGLPSKHPGELLASKRLRETVQELRQFGIVILDTPPARVSADAIALSAVADATVVVARSGETRMRSLHEATNGLHRDGVRQLGVVLVGTSNPLSLRFGDYQPNAAEQPLEPLELVTPPPPVQLNPRPVLPGPEPRDDNRQRNAAE